MPLKAGIPLKPLRKDNTETFSGNGVGMSSGAHGGRQRCPTRREMPEEAPPTQDARKH